MTMSGNSNSDLLSWRERIKAIQTERVTPEILHRIQENASRQKRAEKSYRTAQFLERVNYVSSASNAVTLRELSRKKSADPELQQTSGDYAARSNNIQTILTTRSKNSKISAVDDKSESENGIQDDAEENDQLDRLEQELISRSAMAPTSFYSEENVLQIDGGDKLLKEVDELLEQFAVEPTNDAELAAKFTLFEHFLANVSAIRDQTIEFWNDNKDQFLGASRIACEQDISAIDSADNMGIADDGPSSRQKWFVHAMTKKANQNSIMIAQILAKLRSRLELLSQELGECPCCLESLAADSCTTLGCCHKVCSECWNNWVQLKGSDAFCPLCKHREFVEEVFSS